jgi:hypothetical protein
MNGGVRQRIERAERAALESKMNGEKDYVAPPQRTTREQTVSTSSVRQRMENAVSDAAGDEVIRPSARPAELTQSATYNTSVRDRLNRAADAARPPEVDLRTGSRRERSLAEQSAAEDARIAQCQRDNARMVAEGRERARQREVDQAQRIQTQRVTAQQQREEQARQESEQRLERARLLPVDLILGNADAAEVARVKSIVARKFPADKYSPERHWSILMELRALSTKPEWAGKL